MRVALDALEREFHMRVDASARLPLAVVPLPPPGALLSRSSLLLMFSRAFRQSFRYALGCRSPRGFQPFENSPPTGTVRQVVRVYGTEPGSMRPRPYYPPPYCSSVPSVVSQEKGVLANRCCVPFKLRPRHSRTPIRILFFMLDLGRIIRDPWPKLQLTELNCRNKFFVPRLTLHALRRGSA